MTGRKPEKQKKKEAANVCVYVSGSGKRDLMAQKSKLR